MTVDAGTRPGEPTVTLRRVRGPRREGLLVELTDAAGRRGIGECAPLPGYSPDTLVDCERALRAAPFAIGPGLPAARFAVETALAALEHARTGRPLLDADPGAPLARASLVTNVADAHAAVAAGYRAIKLKIGRAPFGDELALIGQLRREVDIPLRVDVNGRWSLEQAQARLRALAEHAPEFVEQPVAPADLPALRDAPVAIAADESLHDPGADLDAVFAVANIAVLKPMVVGGIARCRAIAAHDVDIVISHVFDGPVAMRAYEALARTYPGRAHGLGAHWGLSQWTA